MGYLVVDATVAVFVEKGEGLTELLDLLLCDVLEEHADYNSVLKHRTA